MRAWRQELILPMSQSKVRVYSVLPDARKKVFIHFYIFASCSYILVSSIYILVSSVSLRLAGPRPARTASCPDRPPPCPPDSRGPCSIRGSRPPPAAASLPVPTNPPPNSPHPPPPPLPSRPSATHAPRDGVARRNRFVPALHQLPTAHKNGWVCVCAWVCACVRASYHRAALSRRGSSRPSSVSTRHGRTASARTTRGRARPHGIRISRSYGGARDFFMLWGRSRTFLLPGRERGRLDIYVRPTHTQGQPNKQGRVPHSASCVPHGLSIDALLIRSTKGRVLHSAATPPPQLRRPPPIDSDETWNPKQ